MEALQQQVQDRKENLEGTNSVLIQGLSYLPGWNEKNFQVWMPSNSILAAAACDERQLLPCSHVCMQLPVHSCVKHIAEA